MTATTIDRPTAPPLPVYTLTEYAHAVGVSYPTAHKAWKQGRIDGAFMKGKLILIPRETVERARDTARASRA